MTSVGLGFVWVSFIPSWFVFAFSIACVDMISKWRSFETCASINLNSGHKILDLICSLFEAQLW